MSTLSVRIGVLSVIAVMFFSAAEVDAVVNLPCCYDGRYSTNDPIAKCYTQKPRYGCRMKAYLLKTASGEWQCIKSSSSWFSRMILAKQIYCPSVYGV